MSNLFEKCAASVKRDLDFQEDYLAQKQRIDRLEREGTRLQDDVFALMKEGAYLRGRSQAWPTPLQILCMFSFSILISVFLAVVIITKAAG